MRLTRVGLSLQDLEWTLARDVEDEVSFCGVLENDLSDARWTILIILH